MITIKTIMNSKIIHNFIFQFKMKEHNSIKIDIQFQNFRCSNDTVLKIYKSHSLNINVIDQQNAKTRLQQKFLKIDIIDVNMILKVLFLQNINFIID